MDEPTSAALEPRSGALTLGCTGPKMGRTMRGIRGFLLTQAMTFALAALIHFGVVLGGHEHERARIAESMIALILLAGFALTFVSPQRARTVGLTVQGVALLGTLVGLFTVAIGVGPQTPLDLGYHIAMVALLAGGLVVAARTATSAER
jgi:hypothetical protein